MMMPMSKSGGFVGSLNVNDVLLGRGAGIVKRPGSLLLRKLIQDKLTEYHSPASNNATKDTLARQIVKDIEKQQGRFLRSVSDGNDQSSVNAVGGDNDLAWVIADMETVLNKVKQTFRDENPSRRRRQAVRAKLKKAMRSQQPPLELQQYANPKLLAAMAAMANGACFSKDSPGGSANHCQQRASLPLLLSQETHLPCMNFDFLLKQQLREQRRRQDLSSFQQLRMQLIDAKAYTASPIHPSQGGSADHCQQREPLPLLLSQETHSPRMQYEDLLLKQQLRQQRSRQDLASLQRSRMQLADAEGYKASPFHPRRSLSIMEIQQSPEEFIFPRSVQRSLFL